MVAPNWTDEMTKLAVELWPTHNADDVADAVNIRFKTSINRNGVIGKMNRLGISKATTARANAEQRQAKAAKPSPRPPRSNSSTPAINPVPFVPRAVETWPRNVALPDLGEDTCRYEVSGQQNSALYRFCNAPARAGASYCPGHARLCFLPSDKRKRKAAA